MSQIVWPDWDMFQSHDPWALQQAVARAVSGGPVYITDNANATKPEIVKPLAFSDSRLPLPDHPALPVKDVLMRDPYNEPVPLKVFTRVTVKGMGVYGIVAVFNINKDDKVVEGTVSLSDAQLGKGSFLVYEYFTGETRVLRAGEKLNFKIEPMGVKLFIISPIKSNVAVVGLKDVYIMPRGVVSCYEAGEALLLEVYEPGTLVVWSAKSLRIEGGDVERVGELYIVRCRDSVVKLSPA